MINLPQSPAAAATNRQIAILNALPAHIALIDPEGVILSVNEAWRRFAAANVLKSADFCVGQNYISVCEQANGDCSTEAQEVALGIREVLAGRKQEFTIEYPCHSLDEKRWYRLMVTPLHEDRSQGAVVMHINITERKLAEMALRDSEVSFRAIFEQASIGVARVAPDGRWLDVNARLCEIVGYTREELLSGNFQEITHPDDLEEDLDYVHRMLADEIRSYAMEKRYIRKNGSHIWIHLSVALVRESAGDPHYFISTVQDISARKQAEASQRESDRRLLRLVDSNMQGVIFWNKAGAISGANDAFLAITGYTRADLEAGLLDWSAMTPPEYAHVDQHALSEIAATGICTPFEKEYIRKDGSRVPILLGAADFEGSPDEGVCFVIDTSKRKQAEDAVRESEAEFRSLAESVPQIVWATSPDGSNTYINQRWVDYTGMTMEESHGDGWNEPFHPDDRQMALDAWRRATHEMATYELECRLRRSDGVYRWWLIRGVPLHDEEGKILRWLGTCTDVEDIKQAENVLKRSEARYRTLFDYAPDGILTVNTENYYTDANLKICEMLGNTRDEIVGMHASQIVAEFEKTRIGEATDILNGGSTYKSEWTFRRKNGSEFVGEVIAALKPSGNRIVIIRDITERKLAEQAVRIVPTLTIAILTTVAAFAVLEVVDYSASPVVGNFGPILARIALGCLLVAGIAFFSLKRQAALHQRTLEEARERETAEESRRKSDERYRDLVENVTDIIYSTDLDGNFTFINGAGDNITGYSRQELLTMNLSDLVATDNQEKFARLIAAKLTGEDVPPYYIEIIAKDGGRLTVEFNTRAIQENGVPVSIQGIARDITDRKELEEQFRQAQKMESIGVLAGGIAHDFNNLLTAINGYSDLTLKKIENDDPLRPNIKEIRDAGERAAALTAQLLAFSRKQILQPQVLNINTVVTELNMMLRRIVRENIDLRSVLDPELENIKADPGQIEQVIMNLAVNARDAMPDGGILTIETQNIHLDDDYVDLHKSASTGKYVRITVTDTGEGMDRSTQTHLFEPFFTTKPTGKGTGLGLSTVHGIVKQSGGNIRVYSELGHGTTFKIYLPCVDEAVQKRKWIGDTVEDLSGTETILLVEDEEVVRNLVRDVLTSQGYTVLEAASGPLALSLCGTYSEPIHLLLTDVIMPGMSGPDLNDHLVKLVPNIKVLFMSGYTDNSITSKGLLDSNSGFIEKPFTPDALVRKVRDIFTPK